MPDTLRPFVACATPEEAMSVATSYKSNKADWLEGAWTGLEAARGEYIRGETAVPIETRYGLHIIRLDRRASAAGRNGPGRRGQHPVQPR